MRPTRVLIIDDSRLVRELLTAILSADPGIEVVGTAADPLQARDLIKALNPDVLTLDIEMPRMDGLTFLANLMRLRPMPVVMVSTLTEAGAEVTLRALALGAVDFIAKPQIPHADLFDAVAAELVEKVLAASQARIRTATPSPPRVRPVVPSLRTAGGSEILLAIGASTGGTEAIREVLEDLPEDTPGTVIAQHIPAAFSRKFAQRLDGCCAMRVQEAEDGMPILQGHAYVAPGGQHLVVAGSAPRFHCKLTMTEPVHRQRPAVDVLFRSVVRVRAEATGVLLTGMGADGAAGLLAMREAGAVTIAQDEATSVVWGMPGSAVRLGAAAEVLPLGQIAPRLRALLALR